MSNFTIYARVFVFVLCFACSESTDSDLVLVDGSMDAAAPETGSRLDASPFSDSGGNLPTSDSGENVNDDGGAEDAGDPYAWCYSDKRLVELFWNLCHNDSRPCDAYQVRLRLFLDIGGDEFSLRPDGTRYDDGPHFGLFGQCVEKQKRVSFVFNSDEVIDPAIVPGVRNQKGWKVDLDHAGIEYCDTCFTEQGLDPVFWLRGSLDDVKFFQDLENEYPLFIEVRDAEGNLAADFR
jgi:hypothetical protein